MSGKTSFDLPGYESSLNGAAYYLIPGSGYLQLSGPDRLDFLHRQTTNDLNSLSPKHTLVTTLTSPTARILDVLSLVMEEDTIGVLTLPGYAAQTAAYLQSRIFFMDDVTLSDASTEFAHLELLGPQAGSAISSLGFSSLQEEDEIISSEINEVVVQAFNTFGAGLRLLMPIRGVDTLLAALERIGAYRLETDTYEVLRVEAGLPAAGYELTEDYTPLETGLGETISMTKGCFTGQEVIARQVNFDKVTKQLVGLHLEKAVNAGTPVLSLENSQPAGKITSSTTSPRFGPIALAVLKRPFYESGMQIAVGEQEQGVPGIVTSLPFE